jgi:hypothetical protein
MVSPGTILKVVRSMTWGASSRSAETSCHVGVPTAATSRLPAVIVPPGVSALSFHRA